MENSVMLNAVCNEPVSLKVLEEPFYRKGFSPFVNKQTGTWWEYDDDKKGFFDTGIIAQGRDGNDYVITEKDYDTIVERTLSNVNPTLDEKLSSKLPKSPANWEPWTAEEQAAARERMGFNNAAYLVETIELTESVSSVVRSYDTAGVVYNFKAMRIRIFNTSGDNTTASVSANGITSTYSIIQKDSYAPILLDCTSGLLNVVSTQATIHDEGARNPVMPRTRAIGYIMTSINKIEIAGLLPAGTKIEIYGVRA